LWKYLATEHQLENLGEKESDEMHKVTEKDMGEVGWIGEKLCSTVVENTRGGWKGEWWLWAVELGTAAST
jgi:hypothetical protein